MPPLATPRLVVTVTHFQTLPPFSMVVALFERKKKRQRVISENSLSNVLYMCLKGCLGNFILKFLFQNAYYMFSKV